MSVCCLRDPFKMLKNHLISNYFGRAQNALQRRDCTQIGCARTNRASRWPMLLMIIIIIFIIFVLLTFILVLLCLFDLPSLVSSKKRPNERIETTELNSFYLWSELILYILCWSLTRMFLVTSAIGSSIRYSLWLIATKRWWMAGEQQ